MKKPSLWNLLRKVHENEEGAVSLETILVIGAIALLEKSKREIHG